MAFVRLWIALLTTLRQPFQSLVTVSTSKFIQSLVTVSTSKFKVLLPPFQAVPVQAQGKPLLPILVSA